MFVIVKGVEYYQPDLLRRNEMWFSCLFFSLLPLAIMWIDGMNVPSKERAFRGKEDAMYPEIPDHMLFKEPTGIVFGKDKRTEKYVCKDLKVDSHVAIIGGSGSGKSSCVVSNSILANPETSMFVVDIKGELGYLTQKMGE